jgi:hypothetical protein
MAKKKRERVSCGCLGSIQTTLAYTKRTVDRLWRMAASGDKLNQQDVVDICACVSGSLGKLLDILPKSEKACKKASIEMVPKMQEALESCIEWFEAGGIDGDTEDDMEKMLDKVYAAAGKNRES